MSAIFGAVFTLLYVHSAGSKTPGNDSIIQTAITSKYVACFFRVDLNWQWGYLSSCGHGESGGGSSAAFGRCRDGACVTRSANLCRAIVVASLLEPARSIIHARGFWRGVAAAAASARTHTHHSHSRFAAPGLPNSPFAEFTRKCTGEGGKKQRTRKRMHMFRYATTAAAAACNAFVHSKFSGALKGVCLRLLLAYIILINRRLIC